MQLKSGIFAIAVLPFVLASCDLGPTTYEIEFVGEGENTSSASFTIGAGDWTVQYADEPLPFSATSSGAEPGAWLYLSAQNDESSGSITVKIRYREEDTNDSWSVFNSATSTGSFAIATVSGSFEP